MKTIKKTYSTNNNEIILVERYKSDFNKTILIIGVVHGDEPQGKFLIENYIDSQCHCETKGTGEKNESCDPVGAGTSEERNDEAIQKEYSHKNRMLFIPCLNPDGLELNTRQNANGVDVNRNFPTKNWELTEKSSDYFGGESPASEIETKFVTEVIEEFAPDMILTLHAPYKVVNYDGPAKEIAEKISEIIGYPSSTDIGYPTPGSFGTYSGIERNIPTITLELDEEIDVAELVEPVNKIFDYLANN